MNFEPSHEALGATFSELAHLLVIPTRLTLEKERLGVGGFGEVYLATLDKSSKSPRKVAVKELRIVQANAGSERLAFRLARELKVWAKAQHPNILELVGYYISESYVCAQFVSAYMPNGNVMQYIERSHASVELRLKFVRDIATGLKYLHDFKPPICHGDLKPANVLVHENLDAVLCDFGVSSFLHDSGAASGLTTSKSTKGSFRYMSPELILEDDSKHTLESDVWAWGCTVFEVMTESSPYSACMKDSTIILEITKKSAPGSIDALGAVVPGPSVDPTFHTGVSALRSIIPQCWNFDPTQRPPSSRILQHIAISFKSKGRSGAWENRGVSEGDSFDDGDRQDPGMPNVPAGMELDYNGRVRPQIDTLVPPTAGEPPEGPQKNFVPQLWQMLEDPTAKECIYWSQDGREFIVTNHEEFARLILLKHFKHSNFSSFIRQLDMYDFLKTDWATQPRLWRFFHHRFIRGRPDLLQSIKPKANEGNVPIQYGDDQLQPSLVLQSSSTTLGRRQLPRFDSLFSRQSLMNPALAQGPPLAPPLVALPEDSLPSSEGPLSDPLRSLGMEYHGYGQASQSLYDVSEEGSFDDGDGQDPGMPNDPPGIELDYNGLVKPQIDTLGPPTAGELPKGSQKNFVHKLWQMLGDPTAQEYIHWGPDGREFIVTNHEEFARLILSEHFKHSNFSSFVRQLNVYDFHKTNRAPRSLRGTARYELWVFCHPKFIKGRPDLLQGIKRKGSQREQPS